VLDPGILAVIVLLGVPVRLIRRHFRGDVLGDQPPHSVLVLAHRLAGERSHKHKHYLSGSLFCACCGSRLLFGISTGRQGEHYEYFFCSGRHSGREGCDLPYLPVEQVEEAVAAQWNREVFPPELVAALREQLTAQLRDYNATAEQEQRRMTERVATIRRERFKWAEKAMEGVVPDDIARERQQLLADQLLAAESALSRLSADQDSYEATLHAVLDLVRSCGRAYELSEPKGRRDYNQAFFTGIFLDVDDDEPRPKVAKVRRTPVLAALQEHREPDGLAAVVDQEQQRRQDQSLDGVEHVSVSNEQLLVELRGLEPLTFSLRRHRVHLVRREHRVIDVACCSGRGALGATWGHTWGTRLRLSLLGDGDSRLPPASGSRSRHPPACVTYCPN
jgi:site-specific DNA recombinase